MIVGDTFGSLQEQVTQSLFSTADVTREIELFQEIDRSTMIAV